MKRNKVYFYISLALSGIALYIIYLIFSATATFDCQQKWIKLHKPVSWSTASDCIYLDDSGTWVPTKYYYERK